MIFTKLHDSFQVFKNYTLLFPSIMMHILITKLLGKKSSTLKICYFLNFFLFLSLPYFYHINDRLEWLYLLIASNTFFLFAFLQCFSSKQYSQLKSEHKIMIKLHHDFIANWQVNESIVPHKTPPPPPPPPTKKKSEQIHWLMPNLQNIIHRLYWVFTVDPGHIYGYWSLKAIKTMRYLALRGY